MRDQPTPARRLRIVLIMPQRIVVADQPEGEVAHPVGRGGDVEGLGMADLRDTDLRAGALDILVGDLRVDVARCIGYLGGHRLFLQKSYLSLNIARSAGRSTFMLSVRGS